jgi:hypothetical protein
MRPKIGFIDPVIIDNLGADGAGECSCNRQLASPGEAQQIKKNIIHRCDLAQCIGPATACYRRKSSSFSVLR